MTDEPQRSDDEVKQAVWASLAAFSPTDPVQVEANSLGLAGALADWTSADLIRVLGILATLTAHFYRTLETNHGQTGIAMM